MKLLILDPLTLLGREFLSCTHRLSHGVPEFDFRHTSVEEEHQIADLDEGPALVPPLESADEIVGFDAVVVASDAQASRHDHLLEFLEGNPDAALVDISRLELLRELTTPLDGRTPPPSRQVRVAHPALVATARVAEVMTSFGQLAGSLAVVDPVSTYGRDAIDLLVQQAIQRLRGEQVSELIYDHIRAFNVLAVDGFNLHEEAVRVLPELPLAVTHCLSGCFHGHLAHLALHFAQPVTPEMVRDALGEAEDIEQVDHPLGLDTVPDTDHIAVAPAALSVDGRQLSLTMMVDGLRVGGALTAVAILDALL